MQTGLYGRYAMVHWADGVMHRVKSVEAFDVFLPGATSIDADTLAALDFLAQRHRGARGSLHRLGSMLVESNGKDR